MDHSHHMNMNHNHMNHDHMDHNHNHIHMNHNDGSGSENGSGSGGMDMMTCSMNMLFNWDTNNLCIIFKWWHIRGPISFVFSLLGVIAVAAMFEAVRAASGRYEKWVVSMKEREPNLEINESVPIHSGKRLLSMERRTHIIRAILYTIQSFYGLMLMLIFMTYNGWIMICVAVGAFLGFLVFGRESSATKEGACH